MERKRILFTDNDYGEEWVVVYHFGLNEFDDDLEAEESTEVIFKATSVEVAVRYANQYLKKMQLEEETADKWANAEIVSVELY